MSFDDEGLNLFSTCLSVKDQIKSKFLLQKSKQIPKSLLSSSEIHKFAILASDE